jgi:hypothetical protein
MAHGLGKSPILAITSEYLIADMKLVDIFATTSIADIKPIP